MFIWCSECNDLWAVSKEFLKLQRQEDSCFNSYYLCPKCFKRKNEVGG